MASQEETVRPRIRRYNTNVTIHYRPLAVIIPDFRSDGRAAEALVGTCSTMIIDYPRSTFDAEQVVNTIISWLHTEPAVVVKEILFIGIGMGGLVAADTITALNHHLPGRFRILGLILWNSPRRIEDLCQPQLAWWASHIPVPIARLFDGFSRPIFTQISGSEPPQPLEEDADKELIRRCYQYGLEELLSTYIQKLRYIREAGERHIAVSVPLIYVTSAQDKVVRFEASDSWTSQRSRYTYRFGINGPHCAFERAPGAHEQVLEQAFNILFQRRDFVDKATNAP